MRFVDEATIQVRAGKGGHGCVSFRREKFVPRGGPDGGDGGKGGSVILSRLLSLYDFRLKRQYEARNGQPGMGSQCNGRKGDDLILGLPVGTLVYARDEMGEEYLLADLREPDMEVVAAQGGRGGMGNEHFKTSTMRAPRFAQPGEPGEERELRLEDPGRRRPAGPAQCGQVHLHLAGLGGAAQDRCLSLHHADAQSGRHDRRIRS